MLLKIAKYIVNSSFLTTLALLSYNISDFLLEYVKESSYRIDYDSLKIIGLLLLYSLFYIYKLSKEKFKDFALLLIFIGIASYSQRFYFFYNFEYYFEKILLLGIILLVSYIFYAIKKNFRETIKEFNQIIKYLIIIIKYLTKLF